MQLRRTHTLPTDPEVLRRLARAMRNSISQNGPVTSPEEAFTEAWRRHAQRVRRLHEKLFYRPLLDAVARLPGDTVRLTPEAARARLEALGYRDPAGALRHIEALTTGVRRRAAIQRTLLPVLLGWFADAAEPDAGLLGFRQVSEALGETPWFLRLLRDETKAAERIAHVLASSRYATGLLLRAPEAVAIFADDAELVPRGVATLRSEMLAAAGRHEADAEQAAVAVRSLRRRELLRVAAARVLGLTGLVETEAALTAITTASLEAVLAATIAKIEIEQRGPLPTRFAVIAMGRYGGYEIGFGSDADVIFVHDPLPGQDGTVTGARRTPRMRWAPNCAGCCRSRPRTRRCWSTPTCGPRADRVRWCARSRPTGPTTASAAPWESQALLRAEFAGDVGRSARSSSRSRPAPLPGGGLSEQAARDPPDQGPRRVRAAAARRGPARHVKLGPGGLSDMEWTVQLLQLRHAHAVAGLRTTRTLEALDAAVAAGLVEPEDAAALRASWEFAARIRNAIMLVRGRPGDTLPAKHDEATAVARLLGYKPVVSGNGPGGWSDTLDPAQALVLSDTPRRPEEDLPARPRGTPGRVHGPPLLYG